MKIRITRPVEGKVHIHLNDRRGATGKSLRANDVEVGDVPAEVSKLVTEWETTRSAVQAARKGLGS